MKEKGTKSVKKAPKEKGQRLEMTVQKDLSRKIVKLARTKKEFQKSFKIKHQGQKGPDGMVASLVITCYDSETKNPLKTYLWKEFHINLDKINKHGNVANTLIVKLSELSEESVGFIKEKHKAAFPEEYSDDVVVPVVKNNDPIINLGAFNRKPASNAIAKKIDLGQLHATIFLGKVLNFEKRYSLGTRYDEFKKLFRYDKGKGDGTMTVQCRDEAIAVIVEKALSWCVTDVVIREKSVVMANLSALIDQSQKPSGVSFCLPPTVKSTLEEIKDRITQVKKNCLPISVVKIDDTNAYKIEYARRDTTSKVHLILSDMGWETAVDENDNLIVYIITPASDEKDEKANAISNVDESIPEIEISTQDDESPIEDSVPQMEISQQVNDEEIHTVANENVNQKNENQMSNQEQPEANLIPDFINLPGTKEEALLYLNQLYQDRDLYLSLPEADQLTIKATLEKTWIKEHALVYAKELLSFFK